MSKELEKEYQKTFNELLDKYNVEIIDDEENLFMLFDEFHKKHKTFSIFEKSTNPKYINAIQRVKEEEKKRKKSVHYLLKVDPPNGPEIDYSNLDLTGNTINSDENEKNLKKILENFKIKVPINSQNMKKKLDEEIDDLGKKVEYTLENEKSLIMECDKSWENFKEDKNLKFNSKDEEQIPKKDFIEMRLKEESLPNEDFIKYISLLRAKKKFLYENDPYISNYNNDIIYKSKIRLELAKVNDIGENPFPSKFKEISNKDNKKEYIKDDIPKEYGNVKVQNSDKTKVYKLFEKDFDNFIKEQYNG